MMSDPNILNDDALSADLGGYWPSYLWTDGEVGEKVGTIAIPMGSGGGGGGGGRAHAANENLPGEADGEDGGGREPKKKGAAAIFEYSGDQQHPGEAEDPRGEVRQPIEERLCV